MNGIARWAGRNAVFVIAALLAALSAVLVPPDEAYLGYVDWRTLIMLLGVLGTITALQRVRFFTAAATRIVRGFRTLRGLVLALVLATAGASALFTNDMALLAFLPLAVVALRSIGHPRWIAFAFVMMTVAANLGGMITPFGSPHNLFLFSRFGIPLGEFLGVMLVPFAVSMLLISVLCLVVPATPIDEPRVDTAFARRRTLLYLALFVLTLLIVFRLLPLWAGLAVPLVLLVADRGALRQLDWGLLGTFAAFFVFAGNLARIPAVEAVLRGMTEGNGLLTAALTSQVISNVPAAILLAPFTSDAASLLVGVNVGGVGTLVASLASLIALAQLRRAAPGETRRFLGLFAAVNAGFFAVLLGLMLWLFGIGAYAWAGA